MSNAIFPVLPGRTWNITRAPIFATKVQQSVAGIRVAASFQPYPLWRWTLEHGFLRNYGALIEWETLTNFFLARRGSFDTFLYDDPDDDSVAAQLIGTGTGSLHTFQLLRTLSTGGFSEPVYNLNGSPQIFLNGALQLSGYTISNGVVTFTSAPANGVLVSWTGSYYWRCAFETDTTQFAQIANGFWSNKEISFVSILGS